MRHNIAIIICGIMCIAAQGIALADDGGVPPPPLPSTPACTQDACPAPPDPADTEWGKQCKKASDDSAAANVVLQKDLEDVIAANCAADVVAKVAKKHGITVKKKNPPKKHKPPTKPKTTHKAVDGKDGKDGLDGKDGEDGKDGADGKSWLWSILDDASEANCNGGFRLLGGLDVDGDGTLQFAEGTVESDCYGESASAADGRDGRDGRDGTKVRVEAIVSAAGVDSATEPETYYVGAGLGIKVQNGKWQWSGGGTVSPGLDGGRMLKTSLTYFVTPWLGATVGAAGIWAGLDEENRAASQFVGATPGLVLRLLDTKSWKSEVELHGFIGESKNGAGEKSLATGGGITFGVGYQF